MIRAIWCLLAHNRDFTDIQEHHVTVHDMIACTGSIRVSGFCPRCKERRYWDEEA